MRISSGRPNFSGLRRLELDPALEADATRADSRHVEPTSSFDHEGEVLLLCWISLAHLDRIIGFAAASAASQTVELSFEPVTGGRVRVDPRATRLSAAPHRGPSPSPIGPRAVTATEVGRFA